MRRAVSTGTTGPDGSALAGTWTVRMDKEKQDKLDTLVDLIKALKINEFTGSLKINFSQGGIGRIEKLEEMKLKSRK